MNGKPLRLSAMLLAIVVASGAIGAPAGAPAQRTTADPASAGVRTTPELLGALPGTESPTDTERDTDVAVVAPAATPRAASAPLQRPSDQKTPRATALADMPAGLGFDAGPDAADTERVMFQRAPVRIVLPVNRERLITFPGPVAFHAPEGFETLVQSQIIERTAYLKPLAPFGTLRVVAEDLATGRLIPIDLVADAKTRTALRPVEVMVAGQASSGSTADTSSNVSNPPPASPALDMVGLTRFAAQSLYAPRRLAPAAPGVKQLPIAASPVEGLYRGWRVQTTPIGAWRSGQLYVTALRFSNEGQQPIDIDLQEMRGRWLAATAQHTRLLAAGSDWSTTTVYLVCDRPFEACR